MARGPRDDRVRPLTRGVAYFNVPFLLVVFAVLYPVPTDTGRLFAWQIKPTLTAMVLASAYLGGVYFFLRAGSARSWQTIKASFPPVTAFAALLGTATILHWNKFLHAHVAFWLWAGLYFAPRSWCSWCGGATGQSAAVGAPWVRGAVAAGVTSLV